MRWHGLVGDNVREVELIRSAGGMLEVSVDGRAYLLDVSEPQPGVYSILLDGRSFEAIVEVRKRRCHVRIGEAVFEVAPGEPGRTGLGPSRAEGGRRQVRAVMPGRVLRVNVAVGQSVEAREGLVVVEAMKMENEVTAPAAGVVKELSVRPGQTVESGDTLVVIDANG